MIKIKMYEGKWQIQIGGEIWQFKNLKQLKKTLSYLLYLKNKFGRLENE